MIRMGRSGDEADWGIESPRAKAGRYNPEQNSFRVVLDSDAEDYFAQVVTRFDRA
jgi:hypothetical protein